MFFCVGFQWKSRKENNARSKRTRKTYYGRSEGRNSAKEWERAIDKHQRKEGSTRGRGEVLGQAGVAKACAYHLNRSIKDSKK